MDDCCRQTEAQTSAIAAQGHFVKSQASSDFNKDFIARVRSLLETNNGRPQPQKLPTKQVSHQSLLIPNFTLDNLPSRGSTSEPKTFNTVRSFDFIQLTLSLSLSGTESNNSLTSDCHRRIANYGAMSTMSSTKSNSKQNKDVLRRKQADLKSEGFHRRRPGGPLVPRPQRSRLPWLDGNKSKPTISHVHIPGEFAEHDEGSQSDSLKSPLDQGGDAVSPTLSSPTYRPSQLNKVAADSTDSLATLNNKQFQSPELQPLHQPKPTTQALESDARSRNQVRGPNKDFHSHDSQPAYSLAALARELRPSHSSPSMSEPQPKVAAFVGGDDHPSSPSPLSGGPNPGQYAARRPEAVGARSHNLRESIASLEHLISEASQLAQSAARDNRSDELPKILGEAAHAIHEATEVRDEQRKAIELPLAEAGGAVPYDFDPDATSSSDEGSTYSRASSLSSSPPHSFKGPLGRPVVEVPAAKLPRSEQASAKPDLEKMDWAYSNSRPNPENVVPTPLNESLRKRQPRKCTRFEQSPLREEILPHAISPGKTESKDQNEIPANASVPPRLSSLAQQNPKTPEGSPSGTDAAAYQRGYGTTPTGRHGQDAGQNWGRDKFNEKDYIGGDDLKGKRHITLGENQRWSIHHHRRQPIARNWSDPRKRFTAAVACLNTALIGIIIGIYAGEVPAIQYAINDMHHLVLLGNVLLYIGMAITTFFFWPLPLLHGRKPYTLVALAITLPLQFPQAIIVTTQRVSSERGWITGLLVSRALSGVALGFAHINFKTTLLDLFGASLQSSHPHGEVVIVDDVRRHGGGMGIWLGIWSCSAIGSLALGFLIGAEVISGLNISWGFYITVILIAVVLFLDVLTPETRRAPHRRTMQEVELPNLSISRRVARGEIKMHVQGDGPKWWWEEVIAGVYLSIKMLEQPGFGLMALYLGWVYGQVVLIIVLLGNLMSAGYRWHPEYVGLAVLSIAVGAILAIPNTKANLFSKSRSHAQRTDSMTFQPRVTWSSHMVRRFLFMTVLPLAGIAYTVASSSTSTHYMAPIIMAGLIGYISNLAIAECHGLIMEVFDTSDLQPGVNSKHRLQSLPASTRRRRTTYSSFPRVSSGFFVSQTLGFLFAAAATGVGGAVTRNVGARKATAITAGILLFLTLFLTMSLWRYKSVQVIPNALFGGNFGGAEDTDKRDSITSTQSDQSWRAVIVGNPSGKLRRMSLLELGGLSRWTEIRRLNRLLTRSTTQPLNPGWR